MCVWVNLRLASLGPISCHPLSPKLSPSLLENPHNPKWGHMARKQSRLCWQHLFPLLDWTEAAPQALPETRGSPEPQGSPSAPPLTQMRPLKLGVGGKLGSWPSLPWVSRLPGLSHTHGHLWAPAASAQHCLGPSSDPVCRAMGAGSPSQARHREGPERARPL